MKEKIEADYIFIYTAILAAQQIHCRPRQVRFVFLCLFKLVLILRMSSSLNGLSPVINLVPGTPIRRTSHCVKQFLSSSLTETDILCTSVMEWDVVNCYQPERKDKHAFKLFLNTVP